MKTFRIGEVAKRAGVTVRTLHYYEEIGLLTPSERTSTGHRRYGRAAIERLQQIKSLQQMGLSLAEIEALLKGQRTSPTEIVEEHLLKIQKERAALEQIENKLQLLLLHLKDNNLEDDETVEVLFSAMEAMNRYEDALTPKQWAAIKEKHSSAQEAAETEWNQSLLELRQEMEAGTPPNSARVQACINRWSHAMKAFLPESETSMVAFMMHMFQQDEQTLNEHGMDPELLAYIQETMGMSNPPQT